MTKLIGKKKIIVVTCILILFLILLFVIPFIKYLGFEKSIIINKTSDFFTKGNLIIEITPDKKLYEHNFDGDAKLVEENTSIIFIRDRLQINADGSVYLNNHSMYSNNKIATIEGAVVVHII